MTTLTEVLADLTDAGDVVACRLSSGGKHILLQDSSALGSETPTRRDRERSQRIDEALFAQGYLFVGLAYTDSPAAEWLHYIRRSP
jgi:hypothetical protein